MAASIQERSGKFQLRITHRLLPKPFFYTALTREDAETIRDALLKQLSLGIVPHELLAPPEKQPGHDPLVAQLITDYQHSDLSDADADMINVMRRDVPGLRRSGLDYGWVESYVHRLKVDLNLSPNTVRKRVGMLARVLDWHNRQEVKAGRPERSNPFRLLPKGYSKPTREEVRMLIAADKPVKVEKPRDYRVPPEHEARIRAAIMGTLVHPERERGMHADAELDLLMDLIINTGVRLFEAYRSRIEHLDFDRMLWEVQCSKMWRGETRTRIVPLLPHLVERLKKHCEGRTGLVFSFWDGTLKDKKGASSRLSQQFATAFFHAGVPHLHEHDLRHEATCRWITMRDAGGRWLYSDTEICRIMSWQDTRMMLRYASLRGEDLSLRLRAL